MGGGKAIGGRLPMRDPPGANRGWEESLQGCMDFARRQALESIPKAICKKERMAEVEESNLSSQKKEEKERNACVFQFGPGHSRKEKKLGEWGEQLPTRKKQRGGRSLATNTKRLGSS